MIKPSVIALVDCNSFYCSCERVFNPFLEKKPVIVLSNNDGCVIARTDESKALGIKMGEPYFKVKDLIKEHNISVFSSNYNLYGDMSRRVMNILREYSPLVEVYSIDEAFLDFSGLGQDLSSYAYEIKDRILRDTGIPVSIGIGSTKVLAKLANNYSKKNKKATQGVFSLLESSAIENTLKSFPVSDVWGVGQQSVKKLKNLKIYTAQQLRDSNELMLRKHLTVIGSRIVQELRGISCIALDEIDQDKKNMCSSRSFGQPILAIEDLKEAVANHAHTIGEKLRKQKSLARSLTVFIQTNPFNQGPQYYNSATIEFLAGTASTLRLIKQAFYGLESIFRSGVEYKKCGIIINDLVSKSSFQLDFFGTEDSRNDEALMTTMDQINLRNGRGTLKSAACGIDQFWKMQSKMKSPAYTTRWSELLTIDCSKT